MLMVCVLEYHVLRSRVQVSVIGSFQAEGSDCQIDARFPNHPSLNKSCKKKLLWAKHREQEAAKHPPPPVHKPMGCPCNATSTELYSLQILHPKP